MVLLSWQLKPAGRCSANSANTPGCSRPRPGGLKKPWSSLTSRSGEHLPAHCLARHLHARASSLLGDGRRPGCVLRLATPPTAATGRARPVSSRVNGLYLPRPVPCIRRLREVPGQDRSAGRWRVYARSTPMACESPKRNLVALRVGVPYHRFRSGCACRPPPLAWSAGPHCSGPSRHIRGGAAQEPARQLLRLRPCRIVLAPLQTRLSGCGRFPCRAGVTLEISHRIAAGQSLSNPLSSHAPTLFGLVRPPHVTSCSLPVYPATPQGCTDKAYDQVVSLLG